MPDETATSIVATKAVIGRSTTAAARARETGPTWAPTARSNSPPVAAGPAASRSTRSTGRPRLARPARRAHRRRGRAAVSRAVAAASAAAEACAAAVGAARACVLLFSLSVGAALAQSTEKRGVFTDPEDGKLDASEWLLERKGFLPVPILITEPAIG